MCLYNIQVTWLTQYIQPNGAAQKKTLLTSDDASEEILEAREKQIADLEKELSTMTAEFSKARLEVSRNTYRLPTH